MKSAPYIHFRIPGRGQVTLSCPDGVRRALESGRLLPTSEVWLDVRGDWIPMQRHPVVARLMGCNTPVPLTPVEAPEDTVIIERFSAEHLVISESEAAQDDGLELSGVYRWGAL